MRVELKQEAGKRLVAEGADGRLAIDNLSTDGGPGDGWRPTELLLAGLGGCMMGTMLNFAVNQAIPVTGVSMTLTDEVADSPKRVSDITITMTVEGDLDERQLASLERVAAKCKVGNTLADSPAVHFRLERAS